MENRDGEIHLDSDEARAGSNSNVVRWVLGIGLLLAVIGMSLAWIIPSLNHGSETMKAQNVEGNLPQATATQGSSTDSVVSAGADTVRETASTAGNSSADQAQPTVENSGKAQ